MFFVQGCGEALRDALERGVMECDDEMPVRCEMSHIVEHMNAVHGKQTEVQQPVGLYSKPDLQID